MFNVDDLINKIDTAIDKLKIEQPYIKCDNVKLFFKIFSDKVDVIQNSDNSFTLKYYSKSYDLPDLSVSKESEHDSVDLVCNKIDQFLDNVKNTQIVKEISLNFDYEINRNFLDDYLFNDLIDVYINGKLRNKYDNFTIISKSIEKNSDNKLCAIKVEVSKQVFYEYYLICNVFCINLTLNNYCNISMNNIISKMLLSCNFTKELSGNSIYLNISKEELDDAFVIIDEDNQEYKLNKKIVSKENIEQFNKLENLFKNLNNLNADSNFINNMAFNILLLGNDTNEKNYLLNNIKILFLEKISYLYELDLKKDIISESDFESIFNKKIKVSNFLIISNFEEIENLEFNLQVKIIEKITFLDNITSIVLCGNRDRVLSILRKYKDLSSKFSFVFDCKDYDIDKMYKILISKIDTKKYRISFNEQEVKKTLKVLSLNSKMKNESFLNFVYTKMLKYVIENNLNEFNISCFPVIDKNNRINDSINALNSLIGLNEVKKQVNKLVYFWKFNIDVGNLKNFKDQFVNMFLIGNSGTGKTTVAKILGKILYSLNIIDEDKFIEITPNDLVADYEGQTKTRTKEILSQAKNGLLFIDEAYIFLSKSEYYREALIELLKYMENPRNIVIFAGYSDSMNDFLNLNSGLKSRIATFINFDDYNIDELIEILLLKLKKQQFNINEEALSKIKPIISKKMKEKNFGNARYIDKLSTKILMKHAENIYTGVSKDLFLITKDDIDELDILNDSIKKNNSFGFIQRNGDV